MKLRSSVISFLMCVAAVSSLLAVPPDVGPTPPLNYIPPKAERVVLSNGLVLYVLEDHELPLFDLSLRMKMSPADVPADQVESINTLGAAWRAGGTATRTPAQLNDELEQMAVSVETSADWDDAEISVSCLTKNVPAALDIFADVLLHPKFDEEQLALVKAKKMESLRRKNETPNDIARRAFRQSVYGRTHVYAEFPSEDMINGVTRARLLELHRKVVAPDAAVASAAGDFKKEELIAALEKRLASWKKTGRTVPPYDYASIHPRAGSLFFVQKKATQSRITIGRVGITRHDPDHFPLELADYILGGGGASRLFGEIRSKRGLAYVVGSFVQEEKGPGLVGVGCLTKAPSTVEAVKALRVELDKFTKGPLYPEEISLAKDSITNSFVFRFNSAFNMASEQADLEYDDYPADYLDTYTKKIQAVQPDDILRAGRKYFSTDHLTTVVVGDQKKFGEPLKSVGEVTEIPLKEID